MECIQEKFRKYCNCTYEPRESKNRCCECLHYHRRNWELPACFFNKEYEKTYDRSMRMHKKYGSALWLTPPHSSVHFRKFPYWPGIWIPEAAELFERGLRWQQNMEAWVCICIFWRVRHSLLFEALHLCWLRMGIYDKAIWILAEASCAGKNHFQQFVSPDKARCVGQGAIYGSTYSMKCSI
jgi:hypothetical protein